MTMRDAMAIPLGVAGLGLLLARLTREMSFFGTNTDNQKHVRAAARSVFWKWPSDMHKYAKGKSYMKDVGLLGVALMQRLFRDRTSEHPMTMVCIVAHLLSAVLVFLVACAYGSLPVARFVFLLYLTSFWPYQIILWGGYHLLAQLFLLMAVFCLQKVGTESTVLSLWWVGAGGALGLMLFSSASGRKYLPLIAGAFLWSQRRLIEPMGLDPRSGWVLVTQGAAPWVLCAIALLGTALLVSLWKGHSFLRRLIQAAYLKQSPRFLHPFIGAGDQHPLEYYFLSSLKLLASHLLQ